MAKLKQEEEFAEPTETTIDIARETMLGDLMNVVLDQVKSAKDVWQKLGERDQEDMLTRIQLGCANAVNKAISFIAVNGNTDYVMADVESVTFKDGVKAVLKIPYRTVGAHALADCEGRKVMIVMPDPEEFGNTDTAPKAEADQPDLLNGDHNSGDKEDPLYEQAVDHVKTLGKVSISNVQRKMAIGYNRAARMIEQMEADGIVSAANDSGVREVLEVEVA